MLHTHAHSPATDGEASPPHSERLARRATIASVLAASALLLLKGYAWWQSDSLAMLSSVTDSAFDMCSSLMNMLALAYALKPADDDHRHGHNAIEDIAGLGQAGFILAAMAMIVLQSLERLSHHSAQLPAAELGIGVSLIAMVVTSALVTYQTYAVRRSRSLVVRADRVHYIGDILFNGGVLLAYALSSYGGLTGADPVIAIVIAGVVVVNSWPIARQAYHNLMDREMPQAEKARILGIIAATPQIAGHHKLKTRYSGSKPFIQMHIDIPAALPFREAHAITDRLERALEQAFPGADVMIHPDPVDGP